MKITEADIIWLIEQWQLAFSANWNPKGTQLETVARDCERLAGHGDNLQRWFKRFIHAKEETRNPVRWPHFCAFMREQRRTELETAYVATEKSRASDQVVDRVMKRVRELFGGRRPPELGDAEDVSDQGVPF